MVKIFNAERVRSEVVWACDKMRESNEKLMNSGSETTYFFTPIWRRAKGAEENRQRICEWWDKIKDDRGVKHD